MVTTQALSHERVARELTPYLSDGQTVVLWPGSGGTLVFRKVWDEVGMNRRIFLGRGRYISLLLPSSTRAGHSKYP